MYGKPVMPPQPEGVWRSVYSGAKWEASQGEDRFRRAVYTYWKRTSGYPSMLTFDAPSRDVCTVRRETTNTPLQALVTLNDEAHIELAKGFAEQMTAAAKNPEVLKAFVRASVKGFRDAAADQKKAVASAKKRDNLMREDIEEPRVALLMQSSVLTANVRANGFSHVDGERLARMIAFVAKAMEIDEPPKPGEVFRSDYLPPAAERRP